MKILKKKKVKSDRVRGKEEALTEVNIPKRNVKNVRKAKKKVRNKKRNSLRRRAMYVPDRFRARGESFRDCLSILVRVALL